MFRTWWQERLSRNLQRLRRGRPHAPALEPLEARWLPSFLDPVSFSAGRQPQSVVVGEFNSDGIPDLAVANGSSNNMNVLLGNGDGSFQPPYELPNVRTTSVAVADVNVDGFLDLAVGGGSLPALGVVLGNGDGSFQPPRYTLRDHIPRPVVVGDFNRDGLPDLAALNFIPNRVHVLLGNGDGSFQARTFTSQVGASRGLAVGDFNGDGRDDLVTGTVVLLGTGGGGFQAARTHGGNGVFVAVGDFNGDGVQDLGVTAGNGVRALLGNGNGSFQVVGDFGAGDQPSAVAVGDFNGDGLPDLAVANLTSNNVSVLLGNGDGSFQDAQHFAAGSNPQSLAVEDFNGDGWADLAVANASSDDVSILLNDGDWSGGFPAPGAPTPGHRSGAALDLWAWAPLAPLSRAGGALAPEAAVLPAGEAASPGSDGGTPERPFAVAGAALPETAADAAAALRWSTVQWAWREWPDWAALHPTIR